MIGDLIDSLACSRGWLRLIQDGHSLLAGPLGILVYLPFALGFWFVPRQHRGFYLTATSLLAVLATLGIGYALTVIALTAIAWLVIRYLGRPGDRVWPGVVILVMVNAALILVPQPPWLPVMTTGDFPAPLLLFGLSPGSADLPAGTPLLAEPLYFYLHWAGIGYIFLRSLHVLIDRTSGKLANLTASDFACYLLFPATLRMGPIYRYQGFVEQLHRDQRPHRDFGAAAIRIVVGLARIGIMAAVLDRFPIAPLFDAPETLPPVELFARLYLAPLSIYLWISGYVDLAVGIGKAMGFDVPENFHYPWKATSIADFWRRWHITLGAWLRDYLYIPLGGNRRHVFLNYTLTFTFCGLWHGTYLSYILWGCSQGVGLAVWRLWSQYWKRQRDTAAPLYGRLQRLQLVNSSLSAALGWLLTFHFQILTIAWFMDEAHAGSRLGRRLLAMIIG